MPAKKPIKSTDRRRQQGPPPIKQPTRRLGKADMSEPVPPRTSSNAPTQAPLWNDRRRSR